MRQTIPLQNWELQNGIYKLKELRVLPLGTGGKDADVVLSPISLMEQTVEVLFTFPIIPEITNSHINSKLFLKK